jgi:hypothetical protein
VLLELVWRKYFSAEAIDAADAGTDKLLYRALLMLRDVAGFELASRALSKSDLGAVEDVYIGWVPMLYGVKGVKQYRTHLLRYLLMQYGDLPPLLTDFVRQNTIISTSGRPNHSSPQDGVMETFNYWVANYFGTRVRRSQSVQLTFNSAVAKYGSIWSSASRRTSD